MPRSDRPKSPPSLAIENEGPYPVCGVDEAGRGPLAGPVTAAAVIVDPGNVPDGIADSKTLDAAARERVFAEILLWCDVAMASRSAAQIDQVNIRQATFAAMRQAVWGLPVRPALILIDGRDVPPGLPAPGRALVGGDALSISIGAASIVAKVLRDRMMMQLDHEEPLYGFSRHMGYPTEAHRAAIREHGPSRHHRMSFGPLKALRQDGP